MTMMMRLLIIPSHLIALSMNSPAMLVVGMSVCMLDYCIIPVSHAVSSRASVASCVVEGIRGLRLSLSG